MAKPETIKVDYYFAFGDSSVPHLWDLFTRKGFRHCCAFKWDGFNWILIDPLGQGLDITILNYTNEDDVPSYFKNTGWTVIRIKGFDDMRNSMQTTRGNKSVLGGNTLAIIQLYKKEKHMKNLSPNFNREWLENKFIFGFTGKKTVAAKPEPVVETQEEIDAKKLSDKTLRKEKFDKKEKDRRYSMMKRGRASLISNSEAGLKDTLG